MSVATARRLIERAGFLTTPCDLDLFLFFARHPRSLLSSDALAGFLGYDLGTIAESLEALLAAQVIARKQSDAHAARMYVLSHDGSTGRWLPPLLGMASTRSGRLALRKVLAAGRAGPKERPVARRLETAPAPDAMTRVIRLDPRRRPRAAGTTRTRTG